MTCALHLRLRRYEMSPPSLDRDAQSEILIACTGVSFENLRSKLAPVTQSQKIPDVDDVFNACSVIREDTHRNRHGKPGGDRLRRIRDLSSFPDTALGELIELTSTGTEAPAKMRVGLGSAQSSRECRRAQVHL